MWRHLILIPRSVSVDWLVDFSERRRQSVFVYVTFLICVLFSAEQHWGASGAGMRWIHLLPRCVLLQEWWRHPLRPRHLACLRGAGCGCALLRHLEIPLQGPQRRYPPQVVTTARAGCRFSTRTLCSWAGPPAHRLSQLPTEAANTAARFTKIMTMNCLRFSKVENRFFSIIMTTRSYFQSCFVHLQSRGGVDFLQ